MKFIKACSALLLISFLFASCLDNADDSDRNEISSIDSPSSGANNSNQDNSNANQNNARALLYDDGDSTYCAAFYWYTHYKGELLDPDYIHWYPPKLYSGELPSSTSFGIMNSRIRNYERQ